MGNSSVAKNLLPVPTPAAVTLDISTLEFWKGTHSAIEDSSSQFVAGTAIAAINIWTCTAWPKFQMVSLKSFPRHFLLSPVLKPGAQDQAGLEHLS